MADLPLFFFGAGAGAGSTFTFESGAQMLPPLPPSPPPPSPPPQLEEPAPLAQEQRVSVETASLEARFEAALEQIRCLGEQRDTAIKAERIARTLFNSTRNASPDSATMSEDLKDENDALKHTIVELKKLREGDAKLIDVWQERFSKKEDEIKDLKAALKKRDSKIESTQKEHEANITTHLDDYEQLEAKFDKAQTAASKEQKLAAKTANELEFEKTKSARWEKAVQDTRDAMEHGKKLREDIEKEKEQIEHEHKLLRSNFEDLQARLEETYTFSDDLDALNAAQQSLQVDLDRQTEVQRELERTIIVKDERIAQLEQLYQRERQRALNAQDAHNDAAVAAATSPIHEAPHIFSDAGDSLQDLLDQAGYDEGGPEDFVEEEHTISDITAVSSPPVEPVRPTSTVQVNSVADLQPIEPVAPRLAPYIDAGTSITPSDAPAPQLAISPDVKAVSVEPMETPRPALDFSDLSVADTTPKEPEQEPEQKLTDIILHDFHLDYPPVAPAQPEAPRLTTSKVIESASIAPTLPSTKSTISKTRAIYDQAPDNTSAPSIPRATTNDNSMQTDQAAPLQYSEEDVEERMIEAKREGEREAKVEAKRDYDLELENIMASTTKKETAKKETVQRESNLNNFVKLLLYLLVPILIALALYSYRLSDEVDNWRNGNGFAFRGSYNRGAYGNGRHLFDLIPLAMAEDYFGIAKSIGFARRVSAFIASHDTSVPYY